MSNINLLDKIKNYNKTHCYQYEMRLLTLEEDKKKFGWTDEFIANINLKDFKFSFVTTKEEKKECAEFIKRYE